MDRRRLIACILGLLMATQPTLLLAQRRGGEEGGGSRRTARSRADTLYADAANYQNNGAYELAAAEWRKLITQFPRDPRASKASHYLGYCYIKLAEQADEPDYSKAIASFTQALRDSDSDLREQSLINLGWCQVNQAQEAEPNTPEQREGLEAARKTFLTYLREYRRGDYLDQALYYLGEVEYTRGNPQRAIGYYKKLLDSESLKTSRLRPDACYALGVAYEETKQTARAARQYENYLERHGDHHFTPEVRVRLADLRLTEGKPSEAESLLQELSLDADERLADYALLRLGYAREQQGELEEAITAYQDLQSRFPDSEFVATASLSLGQVFYRSGRDSEAIDQFQKALAGKDAQAADAAHWLAITYLRQQQPQAATELLEDALTWSEALPGRVTLEMDYADALYAQPDQVKKAELAYAAVAREHPEHPLAPRAAYNAAFAALQQGKFPEARTWAKSFLDRYPQDALRNDVAYVAAEALLQEGKHEAAAAAYERLCKADPGNEALPLWTLRMAMAHYLAGDYQAAQEVLGEKLDNFSEADQQAEARFIIGASLLYEEKPREAIRQLEASHQASSTWNSADEVLLLLAEAHQRNQDDKTAKEILEKLLEEYPNTRLKARVEYKLAQLSAALGEYRDAISRYQSIVDNKDASNLHGFANYGIAWSLMQEEEYGPALEKLRPLLQKGVRTSISDEIRLAEGVCLRKLGRLEEAAESLELLLKSNPGAESAASGLYELGLALTEQGDLAEANRHFLRVVSDVPDYPELDKVLYELAWNEHELGNSVESAEFFARLQREFPESPFAAEAVYMSAQQKYAAEEYAEAAALYTRVLEKADDAELREKASYKLGWSLFQQEEYEKARQKFEQQAEAFPTGGLTVDALFMQAESAFKQDRFDVALTSYRRARGVYEANRRTSKASQQVQTLIYLHGAQCLREQKRWSECQSWLEVVVERYSDGPYIATALYELAFCKQNLGETDEALALYEEVASDYRNEIGARAGFMRGEIYFGKRQFPEAIREFQRVMYRFGADKTPESIRNWQVKSAFEAARCTEILLENPRGFPRQKLVQNAQDFYRFIVEKYPAHEIAVQARTRLGELQKLR